MAACCAAAAYSLVGIFFPNPGGVHARAWRLAAWALSAAVYAAHIGYEHFRLRKAPRVLALHAALAVAAGAVALAGAAVLRRWSAGEVTPPSLLLAFALWPLATAVPAFLAALGLAALLAHVDR
jgi:hypothetical protein